MEVIGQLLDWLIVALVHIPIVWKTLLASAAAVYAALIGYVALTHAKAKVDAGEPLGAFWGAVIYPSLAAFMVLDAAVNVTVFTVVFWERPREWTVTGRMQRLADEGTGWRRKFAVWFSRRLNFWDSHVDL